jgi:hypothetical protein
MWHKNGLARTKQRSNPAKNIPDKKKRHAQLECGVITDQYVSCLESLESKSIF